MVWMREDWGAALIKLGDQECAGRHLLESNCSTLFATTVERALAELPAVRAFSSVADMRCGQIIMAPPHNVTKCTNCRGCTDRTLSSAGLPAAAAYYLEKYVLCRLQRCVRPCGGRNTYFPQLLAFDDKRLMLVSTFNGEPLATDMHGRSLRFLRSTVTSAARQHGLATPGEQFKCMRAQLEMAGVVHLDIGCKNIFVKDGALSLGDFDAATVNGFPQGRVHPFGNPPRSDDPTTWSRLIPGSDPRTPAGLCFRAPQAHRHADHTKTLAFARERG
jgi:hypothetical protein